MSWRVIHISSDSHLHLRQGSLVVEREESISIPIDDIGAIVLENRQITISTAVIDVLARTGVLLYVYDETYTPSSILMPFAQHSRQLAVMESQISMSEPLKKRIWQWIVQSKIQNQATVLEFMGKSHIMV